MRVVTRRTGLTADVLRAWEKRYGAVEPERSPGGQRLYSDDDIERLTLLRRATDQGRNISQVVRLDREELVALVAEDESAQVAADAPAASDEAARYLESGMAAVRGLDAGGLESLLRRAALDLGAPAAVDTVLTPLLREFGDAWHEGRLTPAHEHLGSAVIARVLAWMESAADVSRRAPAVVVATVAGQHHELGARLVAVTAVGEGWRVLFLGSDLPADAIAAAARQADARAVALSLIYPVDDRVLVQEVGRLRALLPSDVLLIAGGPGAERHAPELARAGVQILPDLPHLRVLLRSLHPGGS